MSETPAVEPPAEKVPRSEWPTWVRFTLLGVGSRGGATAYAGLSIVTAIASVAIAFTTDMKSFGWGVLVAGAAPVYLRAANWVDARRSW